MKKIIKINESYITKIIKNCLNEMGYRRGGKWHPNKSEAKAFREKMETDPKFAEEYYDRKRKKEETRRNQSRFDYNTAGGFYIPTKAQYDFCMDNTDLFETYDEQQARNEVIMGYTNKEKVNHDFIHIVNEIIRNK